MQMKHSMIAVGWLVAAVAAIGAMVRAQEADEPRPTRATGRAWLQNNDPPAVVAGLRIEGGPATEFPTPPGLPSMPPINFPGPNPAEPFMYRLATTVPGESREARESQAIGNAWNKLKAAESDEDREAASSELREALADQFDKDIERRKKELEAVAAKLKEMQDLLDKRVESADKIIDLRMQVLLQDAEGLGWNNASSTDYFRPSSLPALYQPAGSSVPSNSQSLKPADSRPASRYQIVTEDVTDENNNRFRVQRPVKVQYANPGEAGGDLPSDRRANSQGGR